jgi:hypothetical protein
MHSPGNEKCPFCPEEPEEPEYKTFPGEKNNSTALGVIMLDPRKLTSRQSGVRPKLGKQFQQSKPDSRKRDKSKPYTFQAHHLISGKQALMGESMEGWIWKKPGRIEKDTGYSINNTDNGFWAPSVPKKYRGKWSARKGVLNDDERQEETEAVMKVARAQIHIGPHNIVDPDDPKGHVHHSYDSYIKRKLKAIDRRVVAWSKKCPLCKPKNKKPQTTYQVHNTLDALSKHLQGKITGDRKSWTVFISEYALEYHKPVCGHTRRKKL